MTEIFNEYYINIVKYSSGKEPENIADTLEFGSTVDQIITKIINIHKNHPSIKLIKKYTKNASQFAFKPTNETEILELLKSKGTAMSQLSACRLPVYPPRSGVSVPD